MKIRAGYYGNVFSIYFYFSPPLLPPEDLTAPPEDLDDEEDLTELPDDLGGDELLYVFVFVEVR
jgi:hypothetical protein